MTTNLLEIPFKQTFEVTLFSALSALIQEQYSQHQRDYEDDLHKLDDLRNDILKPPTGVLGLTRLNSYYTQLTYLTTKLPNDVGVDFIWSNALNPSINSAPDDFSFERANIMYNISAMYAGLGVRENRSTADGLKKAHQQFQLAAGCFSRLKEYLSTVSFPRPEDLQDEFLLCLINVMLAQAQECIWQRAVLDQMKDKLIAQLSQQVCKLYSDAATALQKSTAMSPTWIHHLSLKSLHFEAAAQFRMSSSAISSNKYGEEVARLRRASECCRKAQSHVAYVSKSVAQDLAGLTDRVRSNESRAEKDNDMIYVIPVPPYETLTPITPQAMVKPVVSPEFEDPLGKISRDDLLLARLVPFSVRKAADIFEQRKEEIVSKEVANRFRALDLEIQTLLQELGLPGSLTVLEQPLGCPATLLSQSEELRNKGGSNHLQKLLEEVATLATANTELVEQIIDTMDEDAMRYSDADEADEVEGPMSGFRNQLNQYQTFLMQAKNSDELVRTKVTQWKAKIDLLASDERTLSNSIPNARKVNLSREGESAARRVRSALNRCHLLHAERDQQLEDLRIFAEDDDITAALIDHAKSLEEARFGTTLETHEFEDIISGRLAKYTSKVAQVETSAEAQKVLVEEIRDANKNFVASRSAISTNTEREHALQELDTTYHKYREITNNLEEGSRFYSDFHKALCRVSDEVKIALTKYGEQRSKPVENMISATQSINLGGSPTVVSSSSKVTPGTWRPENGIQFAGTPERPKTRSTTVANRSSNVFDPSKHSIRFGPSKG